jgi:cell division protein FtsB
VILMTNDGTGAIDLNTVVGQILARCEQLERQSGDLKSELDMAKITYDTQIQSLEESVDMLKEEMATMRSGKKNKPQPVRQDPAVSVSPNDFSFYCPLTL